MIIERITVSVVDIKRSITTTDGARVCLTIVSVPEPFASGGSSLLEQPLAGREIAHAPTSAPVLGAPT